MSSGSDKYVFLSIAAAITGAMFPSFRCWAWLKCVTGVAWGARMSLLAWHGLQVEAAGSKFSASDVLEAALTWQSAHCRPSCKCNLWENC
jgi:hypothetical protein